MQVDEWVVEWPTLGFLVADWVESHCIVPDGFDKGAPFRMYRWQLWATANHYRVRPKAQVGQLAAAFQHRRSQIVGPQKSGKGPWSATIIGAEAVGPVVFAGFAEGGEAYDCADWGCRCGWGYEYQPGEPMGRRWPTPLIQLLATSSEQTDNVYRPLQAMARGGDLGRQMKVGEEFIRLPNDGRIDVVTSSATARLGNPITFALQDESGVYTQSNRMVKVAQTQRRGLAGMGGRSLETSNAWDPAENSTAQRTYEAQAEDVFKFFRQPPSNLSYGNKVERRKIHEYVYAGSGHVDLDNIDAEAAELYEVDPQEAERFFGNGLVQGLGSWLPDGLWDSRTAPDVTVPDGARVCAGFDGSEHDDWTAIRLETFGGHRFTPVYGPDDRPTVWNPADWPGHAVPRGEVEAAWDELVSRYNIARAYCDPRGWQTDIERWASLYGDEVFVEWATYRITQMHHALDREVTDLRSGTTTHDGCTITEAHVANARKAAKPGDRYILAKPNRHQKIDAAMSDVLAHEAAADARVAGWGRSTGNYVYSI